MPFISLIVPTMRAGGLDIFLGSLKEQTFTDFETVLVDAHYERRKHIVAEEARNRFLAVRHVGLSPVPEHCAFCAYSNAGIAASTGDVLLFLVDYSRLPPNLVERHALFHKVDPTGRGGLMGPHKYVGLDVDPEFPRYERHEIDRYEADTKSGRLDRFMWSIGNALDFPADPHQADGGALVPYDADPKLRMPPGPIGPEFFHAKNESVRRSRVLEVDGYDTDLDGAHLYQDSDFADRLTVKAGVKWVLDPSAVVEIANPRHVFPFARRTRPHEENKAIWERKKAAGYPPAPRPRLGVRVLEVKPEEIKDDPGVGRIVREREPEPGSFEQAMGHMPPKKLRIGMIYGEFSSAIHGPFDLEGLYTRTGLTGSESSFFNLARTLAERGHEVVAFLDCAQPYAHPSGVQFVPIRSLPAFPKVQGVDAVIAWNEPDYLQFAPPGAVRYCDQQLNDFGYCQHPEWRKLVDVWVSPSENHKANVMQGLGDVQVIPNSVDLDLFKGPAAARNPHRVVYCSSPDRGLHHLLSFWPEVRKRVPDATLKVFYRLKPWLDRVRDADDEVGRRARYIEEALSRLQGHGVEVVDLVSNAQMARELQAAAVLAYPCDPVRYTEGFGCSVLDAAAGGCFPIISAADALPEVHGSAALVMRDLDRDRWAQTVAEYLQADKWPSATADGLVRLNEHALAHSREKVAGQWERLLGVRS